MENNLAIQELAIIQELDLGLKQLRAIISEKSIAPIEQVEEVELKCIYSVVDMFTVGKTYKAKTDKVLNDRMYYKVVDNDEMIRSVPLNGSVWKFELSQQEQPADESEWKVGEWAWSESSKTMLSFITELVQVGRKAYVDNQDGIKEVWAVDIMVKPTDEEIFDTLQAIAEKKYPVGTIAWHDGMAREVVVLEHKFKLESEYCFSIYVEGELIPLWYKGK